LKQQGQDTGKTEDGMYKVDLSKPVEQETEPVKEEEVTEEGSRRKSINLREVIEEETKEEPKEEVKEEVQDLQDKVEEAVQTSQDTGNRITREHSKSCRLY